MLGSSCSASDRVLYESYLQAGWSIHIWILLLLLLIIWVKSSAPSSSSSTDVYTHTTNVSLASTVAVDPDRFIRPLSVSQSDSVAQLDVGGLIEDQLGLMISATMCEDLPCHNNEWDNVVMNAEDTQYWWLSAPCHHPYNHRHCQSPVRNIRTGPL